MEDIPATKPYRKGRRADPFTPESARAASLKGWEIRRAREAANLSNDAALLVSQPLHIPDASRDVLPRILLDEVAFRGKLLDEVGRLTDVLTAAIQGREYDPTKASLPALIREQRSLVRLSMDIVDSARHIDPEKAGKQQVSSLVARYGILDRAMRERGLIGTDGMLSEKARRLLEGSASTGDVIEADEGAAVPPASDGGV